MSQSTFFKLKVTIIQSIFSNYDPNFSTQTFQPRIFQPQTFLPWTSNFIFCLGIWQSDLTKIMKLHFECYKSGSISENIFNQFGPILQKSEQKYYPQKVTWKGESRDFVQFVENGTKLEMYFEIKLTLTFTT